MLEEIKNIKSDKQELRKFGLSVGTVLLLIGIVLYYYDKPSTFYFGVIGAALLLLGSLLPKILKPLHKAWMSLAILLGFVSTQIILSLLYFFIITPIALIAKLSGKDFLDEKIEQEKKSYWHLRKKQEYNKEFTERQF